MVPQGADDTLPPWAVADRAARLDERVKVLEEKIKNCVTHDQFWTTKAIALGLGSVSLVTLLAFVLARILGNH